MGYFFAKHLRNLLGDVPDRVLFRQESGGKAIRHFIPKDIQWADPELYQMNEHILADSLSMTTAKRHWALHEETINAWLNGETSSQLVPVHMTNFPGFLFYEHLPPLRNMKFKGMLYYQGESDAGRGQFYRHPLSTYSSIFTESTLTFLICRL